MGVNRKRRGFAALLSIVPVVLLSVVAAVGGGCGDPTDPQARLFVAVHVVERLADGSTAPASGVEVQYEVFGRIRGPANPPLLHEFTNSTGIDGLATTTALFDGAALDDVNLVFVTATHSDGRSAFRRAKVGNEVDLGAWFEDVPGDWTDTADVAARLCEGAESERDCEEEIEDGGLIGWGAAVGLRLNPGS